MNEPANTSISTKDHDTLADLFIERIQEMLNSDHLTIESYQLLNWTYTKCETLEVRINDKCSIEMKIKQG